MPEKTAYEPGEPNWIEISSPDVEAATAFYGGLFGWSSYSVSDPFVGDFTIFTLGDVTGPEVAGLTSLADDTVSATWTCYFTVRDASKAADAVRRAGGRVYMEATDVAHLCRVVLAADDQGAGFGLWQPRALAGCGVVGEPNTVNWMGLVSRDTAAARDFYRRVLGWKEPTVAQGLLVDSVYEWRIADGPVAFMVLADEELLDDDLPAFWLPYFVVADCEATVAAAKALGGSVIMPCTDTRYGPCAAVQDPASAPLGLFQRRP
ncbi:VOC family protein [Actinomadura rugatobispora]|uniref:VOC family protein n=1 Tax=Actinomadura rugatobispora TaxID=1994 RepID=A0ABW1AFC1_9ACTN|nr:VOC family protein [Actinomadura rugatobispora]